MHASRLSLIVVALIAAALFVSAVRVSVSPVAVDRDHGWPGPHPDQLVSYDVEVVGRSTGWGQPVTIVSSVPGNGLVITGVMVAPSLQVHNMIQVNENSTTPKITLNSYFKTINGRYYSAYHFGLATGVPIAKGSSLSVKSRNPGTSQVTITGYTW